MIQKWEPDTQYDAGDVVKYEGQKYKNVQPHRSQSDRAPPLAPALWACQHKGGDSGSEDEEKHEKKHGKHDDKDHDKGDKKDKKDHDEKDHDKKEKKDKDKDKKDKKDHGEKDHDGKDHDKKDKKDKKDKDHDKKDKDHDKKDKKDKTDHDEKNHDDKEKHSDEKQQGAWDDYKTQSQQIEISPDEQKKHWYDLEPERKKQLEIGGGLLVGAAAIGAGYLAYKHHEKNEEEKKADVWSLQGWLKDAQDRTEKYHKQGASGEPASWILVHGKNIPQEAIKGGHEAGGEPLYIARCHVDGSIQVGKASSRLEKGGIFTYGEKENSQDTYEVLVGDIRALRWVDAKGKFEPEQLGVRPVEGGREADGTPLHIVQTQYEGSVIPGKTSKLTDGALVSSGGAEVKVQEYHVLCYQ